MNQVDEAPRALAEVAAADEDRELLGWLSLLQSVIRGQGAAGFRARTAKRG